MPLSDHLPGIGLTAVVVALALAVNGFAPLLSPAVVAVAAGAALANTTGIGERFRPGLRFVAKRVLRVAIVLLGLQIAVPQVLALGWQTAAVVVTATGLTFTLTPLIGRRLGLSRGTSLLVATGVSICGAAAVAAMHDSVDSSDDDAASAIGVVVLYGSAAIVVVPLLGAWLGLSPAQLGVWSGAAVHEVAQVAAIGAATGVLATGVTVKLGRVVLLAPIVAHTSYRERRAEPVTSPALRTRPHPPVPAAARHHAPMPATSAEPAPAAPDPSGPGAPASPTAPEVPARRPPIMPLFVAGFLLMVALRSTGLVPVAVTGAVPRITSLLTAAALFGLGTGIDGRRLLRGGRAMLLGAIATGLIGAISLTGVVLLV
jgi:uncharacterized membrane protein YadS